MSEITRWRFSASSPSMGGGGGGGSVVVGVVVSSISKEKDEIGRGEEREWERRSTWWGREFSGGKPEGKRI